MTNLLYSLMLFNERQEGFFIGLFESSEKARQVVEHYLSALPGFRNYPCTYEITEKLVVGTIGQSQKVYIKRVRIMDDNRLGRNIQHLRIIHNETLDELGSLIHCAKSTVKGYENGSRKPDLQTLQLLSAHYNKSVDELLYTDLTGLENISIDLNSPAQTIELLRVILPLYCSEKAMKNSNFKNGYDLSQRLLEAFSNAEVLSGSMIVRIFESFVKATDEPESPEAVANLVWSIFVWWLQIYDTSKLLSLQNKLLSKKLSIKDYMSLKDTEDVSIAEKKAGFISDFDEIVTEALKALKSEQEWSDLADYYLALRYVVGMVDTELSTEMNSAVGMQMMISFMTLGNSHAFTFFKTCLSEN